MSLIHELIPSKPCGYITVGDPYDKKNRILNI